MLTTTAFLAVAMQCAAAVHPSTSLDVARVESGFNPYAIAEIVPGSKRVISHNPQTKGEALAITDRLAANGHRYSVGLMQITSTNFTRYGVTAAQLFDPCTNLKVYQKIIVDCYQRGGTLPRALSCYYTGNFDSGQEPESTFANTSYVQRIGYVVPSTRADRQATAPSGYVSAVPPDNTVYPDSVIRGVIPAPDTTPNSVPAYSSHVVRSDLSASSD